MAKNKISAEIGLTTSGKDKVKQDVGEVESAVSKVSGAVDQLTKRIGGIQAGVALQSAVVAFDTVKNAVTGVVDAFTGVAETIFNLGQSQAQAADQIGKLSLQLGMQVGDLQGVQSAAQHAGMSVETINGALQRFSVATARAAAGEKSQIELFNALGIATKNADGSIKDQTTLLLEAADAYTKITNAQDKNRVSQELFGRSAAQMSLLLADGSEGLRSAIDEFGKSGAGFTPDQVKQAAAFNDTLQGVQENIQGIKNDLFFAVVPAFTKLFENVASFVKENRPAIDSAVDKLSKNLPKVLDGVTKSLPTILSGFVKISGVVSDVLEFTGPWIPLFASAAAVVGGSLLAAVTAVGAAVVTIGPVIAGTVIPALGAAAAAAAPVVGVVALVAAGVASWGYVIKTVYDNWDMLMSFIGEKIDWFMGNMEMVKSFVFDDVIGGFVNLVTSVFDGIANTVKGGVASVLESLSFVPGIGSNFEKAAQGLRSQMPQQINQETPSNAVPTVTQFASRSSGSQSSLSVDFSNVPRGTTIKANNDFDYGNIDYSAGYAFGGF